MERAKRTQEYPRRIGRKIIHLKTRADTRYGNLSKLIQYLMVGGLGALVNLATVTLFQILKFGPMISITGGIAISVVHNFFWHRELTFRDSKTKEIYRQFMMFVTFSLAGLSVNFLVAQVLVLQFVLCQDWPQLAAACGILAGLVINFVTSRYIVFKP